MSRIAPITIAAAGRDELERLVRDRNTAQKVVWRARIVLLAAEGLRAGEIAAATGKSQLTVRRWRRRFLAKGVEGLLKDASRPPRRKPLTAEKIAEVVHLTLHTKPPNATHWSVRTHPGPGGEALAQQHPEDLEELCLNLGDGVNQAANLASSTTSIPSRNLAPLTTFGNWF
jgi:integrase